jgi:hypothetical protein
MNAKFSKWAENRDANTHHGVVQRLAYAFAEQSQFKRGELDCWLDAERVSLRDAPRVDVIYDDDYDGWEQLDSLSAFLRSIGLRSTPRVFLHQDLVDRPAALLEQIPSDAMVLHHTDTNTDDDVDGTAVLRFLEQHLGGSRVLGNSSLYCANCLRKSNMFSLFSEYRLPTPPTVSVREALIDDVKPIITSVAELLNSKLAQDDNGNPSNELFIKVLPAALQQSSQCP